MKAPFSIEDDIKAVLLQKNRDKIIENTPSLDQLGGLSNILPKMLQLIYPFLKYKDLNTLNSRRIRAKYSRFISRSFKFISLVGKKEQTSKDVERRVARQLLSCLDSLPKDVFVIAAVLDLNP